MKKLLGILMKNTRQLEVLMRFSNMLLSEFVYAMLDLKVMIYMHLSINSALFV